MSPSSIPSSSRVSTTSAPPWQIPQGHFLAQQGKSTSATHSSSSSDDADNSTPPYPNFLHTTASSPPPQRHDGIPTDTSTLAGADFDVDVRSGFLPPEPPLERIPGDLAESCWEQALDAAREAALNIHGGGIAVTEARRVVHRAWRRAIRQMHVVIQPSHKMQTDIRFARRGHLVLTFLAHFYLHSQPQPSASQPPPAPSRFWWSRSPAHATQDAIDARDEAAGKYAATLPPSLSIPLLQLSSQLDIPPILTYADTVLWNWKLKDASKGLTPSNIVIAETFSGTTSEEHFYLTSLLIELRGVAALDVMRVCLDECFMGDALAKKRVAKYLQGLCLIIADLEAILKDVRSECDPPTFYWAIRPWFRGGDASPLETKGWIYPTTVDPDADPQSHTVPRLFTGPSAGQSSLIHALDVFLDVDHAGIKPRQSRPALTRPVVVQSDDNQGHDHHPHITADASSVPPDATFLQRMQLYMPGQHRRFLTHLQTLAADAEGDADADADAHMNIDDDDDRDDGAHTTAPAPTPLRHLAMTTLARQPTHPLPLAYDAALRSLRSLRDEHMRVATLYIVSQARSAPPRQFAELSGDFVGSRGGAGHDDDENQQQQHNGADTLVENDGAGAKGTGGTNLVHFLKACRANTVDALLSSESA